MPKPIHAVFCCVGGGGLISGVAAYIKRLRPETRIVGVEAVDADAMARSLHAGKRVRLEHVGLFADGAAVKYVGEETFRLCQHLRRRNGAASIPTPSARRSRTSSRTRARCSNRPARWRWPAPRNTRHGIGCRKDAGGHRIRRQHELRPPAFRRRKGGDRRTARGGLCRDAARAPGATSSSCR
jgi:hypothetical protein